MLRHEELKKREGKNRFGQIWGLCMKDERIQWIDALKGFGILCVTFGHLAPWYPLETHIYSFHMCLFFFISGYLFRREESLSSFIAKKFTNILIPFLAWDLLASLVAIALGKGIKETVSKFFVINGRLCWNAPIWFLLILFIAESLYKVIAKYGKSKRTSYTALIISAVLWILVGAYPYSLKLNLVPLALFFYALGDIFHISYREHPATKTTIIVIALIGMTSVLFGTILNIRISYTGGFFGNIYYCIIAAVAGTLFYVLIFQNWRKLGENKILCMLGQNSLIIMATQYWLFYPFDAISQKLFCVSVWHSRSTVKALAVTVITVFFIMISVSIFKKRFRNNKRVLILAKYIGIR